MGADRHINLAQKILKEQFPNLNGLNSTLLQLKQKLTEDTLKINYKLFIVQNSTIG